MITRKIKFTLNGHEISENVEPRLNLADFLRHSLGVTGTHVGCEHGVCGACTVNVDGLAVRSCLMFAIQADGKSVTTIEGVAPTEVLHPLQQKFLEHAALQCGICTPGFLVSAKALLEQNPDPTEEEIRFWLAGNLCRCTVYDKIITAVQNAAKMVQEKK